MVTTAPSSEHIQINVEHCGVLPVIVSWNHSKVKGLSVSLQVTFKDTEEQCEVHDLELINVNLMISASIIFEPGKLLTRGLTFTTL